MITVEWIIYLWLLPVGILAILPAFFAICSLIREVGERVFLCQVSSGFAQEQLGRKEETLAGA